jgi:hypothetical protein
MDISNACRSCGHNSTFRQRFLRDLRLQRLALLDLGRLQNVPQTGTNSASQTRDRLAIDNIG